MPQAVTPGVDPIQLAENCRCVPTRPKVPSPNPIVLDVPSVLMEVSFVCELWEYGPT